MEFRLFTISSNLNDQNRKNVGARCGAPGLEFWSFEFVSDFDIRISNLKEKSAKSYQFYSMRVLSRQ
jgi:hypothetical protein